MIFILNLQMQEVLIDLNTFPLAFTRKEQLTFIASQEVQGPASAPALISCNWFQQLVCVVRVLMRVEVSRCGVREPALIPGDTFASAMKADG